MAFNIDSGDPNRMVIAAIGADRWTADVLGRSAHAGVHPEDGVSAVAIALRLLPVGVAGRGTLRLSVELR